MDQNIPIQDFLGLLADDLGRAQSNEDARDVAAAALVTAFKELGGEFQIFGALLRPNWQLLEARAQRAARGHLSMRGRVTRKPFLAACARVAEFGFVNAQGARARQLLFMMLVQLLHRMPASSRRTLAQVADGLRILIERLHRNPRTLPEIESVWELFDWVEQSGELAQYVKDAWRNCRPAAISVLTESDESHAAEHRDESAGVEPLDGLGGLGVHFWRATTDEGNFDYKLPDVVEQEAQANSLTRIASLSRFTPASLLSATREEMQVDVSFLLAKAESQERTNAQKCSALASLLCIATGTPLDQISRIHWIGGDWNSLPNPGYPGALTDDGRWLVRSEYNPRRQKGERFQPKTIHIPIPPTLSRLLRMRKHPDEPCGLVIPEIQKVHTRRQAIWTTTLFGALSHNSMYGKSVAQHVLAASYGLEDAPIYYDRIRADAIAHEVAGITFPWFADEARPPAAGMPRHSVGSVRGRDPKEVRLLMEEIRAKFDGSAPVAEQLSQMALHVFHGLVIAGAMRINGNLNEIGLKQVGLETALATLSDKRFPLDHHHRLIALPSPIVTGILAYLKLLEAAASRHQGTELGRSAARALRGEGPVFLIARGHDVVAPLTDQDYLQSLPPAWRDTPNWARHGTNNLLATRVPVHLRVAQMGWTGATEGGISRLATVSAKQTLDILRPAIAAIVRELGWRPIVSELGLAEVPVVRVDWGTAWQANDAEYRVYAKHLDQGIEDRLNSLAIDCAGRVNAFLQANGLPLKIEQGELVSEPDQREPVQTSRALHAALEVVIAGGRRSSSRGPAAMLVYRWMKQARASGFCTGPMPRAVIVERPRGAGDFLPQVSHATHHANLIWGSAINAELSLEARVLLTTLLHGGFASADLVAACMHPDAALWDIQQQDKTFLLIHAPEARESAGDCATGTVAFDGLAALALRTWHRSGRPCAVPDGLQVRKELCNVYEQAFATPIDPEQILAVIESLVAARNALVAPGVLRHVAMGKVVPTFAPLRRVVALHEDWPVRSQGVPAAARLMSATRLGSSARRGLTASYGSLKATLKDGSPDDARKGYPKLIEALKGLGDGQPVETFAHVMILYALALVEGGGVQRESLALSTMRNSVYAVGRRLIEAMPGKVPFHRPEAWEASYVRVIHNARDEQKAGIARSIRYFHRILCRDYVDVPQIQLGPLLGRFGRSRRIEHSGFMTPNELQAFVSCSSLALAEAHTRGNREDVEQQGALYGLALVAASSCLRPREYRGVCVGDLPASAQWRSIKIQARPGFALKSSRARRRVRLRGTWAREAGLELTRNLRRRSALGVHAHSAPLFQRLDRVGIELETHDLTGGLNERIRAVTGNPHDDCYLFRKTVALGLFRSVISASSASPWPMVELLAELGQADSKTLLEHYIHDPVPMLATWMPATCVADTRERAWILGMRVVSARRLLKKPGPSWLYPRQSADADSIASFEIPLPPLRQGFVATPLEAEAVAKLICRGESVENVTRLVGWPDVVVASLQAALDELWQSRVILSSEQVEGYVCLKPPRIDARSGALEGVLRNRRSWPGFVRAFGEWKRFVPLRELDGLPFPTGEWEQLVESTPCLAAQEWAPKHIGLTAVWSPKNEPGKHSSWPRWRWCLLAAWLADRISVRCPVSKRAAVGDKQREPAGTARFSEQLKSEV